jgi:hypothetical protein
LLCFSPFSAEIPCFFLYSEFFFFLCWSGRIVLVNIHSATLNSNHRKIENCPPFWNGGWRKWKDYCDRDHYCQWNFLKKLGQIWKQNGGVQEWRILKHNKTKKIR